MQIFILGATKVGKTTVAKRLLEQLPVPNLQLYEAGAWARAEFARTEAGRAFADEMDPAYKDALTKYAVSVLAKDPGHSLQVYRKWRLDNEAENVLVVGVRSPDDFFGMTQNEPHNVVLRIHSDKRHEGAVAEFEKGLDVIEQYIHWKYSVGQRSAIRAVGVWDEDCLKDDHYVQCVIERLPNVE